MSEQLTAGNFISDVKYYLMDIWYALPIKGAIAAALAFFTDSLGGTVEVFYIYCFFLTLDLLLGIIKSLVFKNFNIHMLNRWMIKVLVQFIVATVLGLFFYMFHQTSGIMIAIINWVFLIYAFADVSSILDKFEQLGINLPVPAKLIIKLLRRKASRQIANILDDPEAAEEIENIISNKKTRKRKKQHVEAPAT